MWNKLRLLLKSRNFWGHFWFYWLAGAGGAFIFVSSELMKIPTTTTWILILFFLGPPVIWETVTDFFHPFIKRDSDNKKDSSK